MRIAALLLLVVPPLAACSRNLVADEAARQATPAAPAPSPAPAAPAPPAAPRDAPASPDEPFPLIPAHEPTTGRGVPVAAAAAPTGPGGDVSGTITIAPELAGKVAPTDVVWIVARAAEGGPPVAIQRIAPPKFPASFTLTAADNPMGGGRPITGKLLLRVKVDKDGDAMSNSAGDLQGFAKDVPAGARGVAIVIDQEVESAE